MEGWLVRDLGGNLRDAGGWGVVILNHTTTRKASVPYAGVAGLVLFWKSLVVMSSHNDITNYVLVS